MSEVNSQNFVSYWPHLIVCIKSKPRYYTGCAKQKKKKHNFFLSVVVKIVLLGHPVVKMKILHQDRTSFAESICVFILQVFINVDDMKMMAQGGQGGGKLMRVSPNPTSIWSPLFYPIAQTTFSPGSSILSHLVPSNCTKNILYCFCPGG